MNLISTKKYKNIIWDWNGTLLNDVAICINAMNILLEERDLPQLTEDKYRNVFTFPVKSYYKIIGFDFSVEDFNVPALKFIDYYQELFSEASLFADAKTVLNELHDNNYNQYILSAMEQNNLRLSVKNLNIDNYFIEIIGINNHFAHSKIERGLELIIKAELDRSSTLMVGDTLHDIDVANAMGIDCILISKGHQSENILRANGNSVVNSLLDIKEFL